MSSLREFWRQQPVGRRFWKLVKNRPRTWRKYEPDQPSERDRSEEVVEPYHSVTRANLDRAVEDQSHLFLSESVRFVHGVLLAIQRGERIAVEDIPDE